MKTIFLTGGTGAMGADVTRLLLEDGGFQLRLLTRPTRRADRVLKPYRKNPRLTIIEGDLVNPDDVGRALGNADYVIHLGGMVSPAADYYPELTMKVNVEAMANIIKTVKASPKADRIKVINIGTVAMSGNRPPKRHWARVGDPIRVSRHDHYGISKVIAERMLIESGLKQWVSLRQNAVLHPALMNKMQAAMFHVPHDCCLEWVTARDSAVLLRNICSDDTPADFWNNVYAIGGGEQCRFVQHTMMEKMFGLLGIKDYKKVCDPDWFATRNFHGYWCADSNELNDLFHFQHETPDSFFEETRRTLPFYYKFVKWIPAALLKELIFRPVAFKDSQGPMKWITDRDDDRVKAHFGSYEEQQALGCDWSRINLPEPDRQATLLEHGYDTAKNLNELMPADLQKAAAFRGGRLLSESYNGNAYDNMTWQCGCCAEKFEASPFTVLRAGHWCPQCDINWDSYAHQAAKSPFFAQIYINND
jgi:nucleoside-diphosphate-sugar epimerase